MQTARNYMANASANMELALHRMPLTAVAASALPSTPQEITLYIEGLLTLEEQHICDMATD